MAFSYYLSTDFIDHYVSKTEEKYENISAILKGKKRIRWQAIK